MLSLPSSAPQIWQPASVEEAWSLLRRFGKAARLLAGGTGAQLDWEAGAPIPEHLIDLNKCAELRGLSQTQEGILRIGALTTLSELRHHAGLCDAFPMLHEAIGNIAAAGIRNLATLGGNVAAGNGCAIPALLALDADVEIFNGKTTRALPLWDFLSSSLTPTEGIILTAILLPAQRPSVACYEKIGLRQSFTPSVIDASAAIWLDASGRVARARLAVGGGTIPPQRLLQSERHLEGQIFAAIDWNTCRTWIVSETRAPSDAFRSGAYRRAVAANAIVAGLGGTAPAAAPKAKEKFAASVPFSEAEVSRAAMTERWRIRPDVAEKVAGRFAYLTDERTPGMLVGRILRARYPHARILNIDTSAAEALPGVHAVVTHRDVPGLNGFGIVIQDQPAFCADRVRYLGDCVAAVAAETSEIAERALSLIRVDYEPLPLVTDAEAALEPDAEPLHEGGNLLTEFRHERGDVDAAFAACAHVVEDIYTTPRQMHAFMETEGGYAVPEPDGTLSICVGGQHGFRDRMQLARILAMDEARIRVVSSPSGGAFGGKDELTVQPALALLALKSKRPVRMQLDRWDSTVSGTKRHPMRIRMKTGCDAEGRLLAQQVELIVDGGAYASLGPAVIETALEHVCGAYRISNVRSHGRLAYTNNGFAGAFRGFGHNEMLFPVESQIGRLAEKAGLDPVAFRWRNLRQPGDRGFHGHVVAPTDRGRETLSAAAAGPLWSVPVSSDGRKSIGTGLALAMQGVGLGSAIVPDDGATRLVLAADGKIEAIFGAEEIGQGVLALIQETVSRELGCERADIRPVIGDTGRTVDSGSTTASRMTYVVWRAAKEAGPALRVSLLDAASVYLEKPVTDLTIGPGGVYDIRRNRSETPLLTFRALAQSVDDGALNAACSFAFPAATGVEGNARFIHCYGVTVARVAVDRVTGAVEVLDLDQHTAAGPVMDVANYLGQIEGGGVQGLGFTLTEDTLIAAGQFVTRNFDTYMVPSFADAPARMKVFAMEELDADDPYGPRGIGELGIAGVTPAIAAAVADATGVWMTAAPFDPEILLQKMSGLSAAAAE